MPYKDSEKRKKVYSRYYQKNRKKRDQYRKNYYHKHEMKIPHRYSYEEHKELAKYSGIETSYEWFECYRMGLMPKGFYCKPNEVF